MSLLTHHNPSAPHLIIFLCPLTLATAAIDLSEDTIHPVTAKHFGTCTPTFLSAVSEWVAEKRKTNNEAFNPRIATENAVQLPVWMLFVTTSGKLCILHTTSPVFLAAVGNRWETGKPIADSPPIPSRDWPQWHQAATYEARRLANYSLADASFYLSPVT